MAVLEQALDILDNVAESIDPDGRYRREKLLAMVAYAVSALLTLVFAFSGGGGGVSNNLGAHIERNVVPVTNEQWFLIQNRSSSDWNGLTMQLNGAYTFVAPKPLPANSSERFLVKDFVYNHYIPHTPRVGGWKSLSPTPPPGAFAPRDLVPKTLTITTDGGEFTALFDGALPLEPKGDKETKEE